MCLPSKSYFQLRDTILLQYEHQIIIYSMIDNERWSNCLHSSLHFHSGSAIDSICVIRHRSETEVTFYVGMGIYLDNTTERFVCAGLVV